MRDVVDPVKVGHMIKRQFFFHLVDSWQGQPGPVFFCLNSFCLQSFFEMALGSKMHRNLWTLHISLCISLIWFLRRLHLSGLKLKTIQPISFWYPSCFQGIREVFASPLAKGIWGEVKGDRMVRKWVIAYCFMAILLSIATALLLYYIT